MIIANMLDLHVIFSSMELNAIQMRFYHVFYLGDYKFQFYWYED